MFTITTKTHNGFNKIIIKDKLSGTFVEIIPDCSSILHAFTVLNNGEPFNVIDSYISETDFKSNVTAKGFLGTKLSPFVCRINKGTYHYQNKEYHIQKYYDGNNALHGMLYDQPFTVTKQHANADTARVTMKHEYRGSDKGYPFSYDCIVTYEMEKDNKLNIITEIINKDSVIIPIQDGWHPYFTLGDKIDELSLQFRSFNMLEFDKELIPTGNLIPYKEFDTPKKLGNTFFDNCFTLNFSEGQPICLLQNINKNIQIEIHTDESYPYLQFYTPSHRNSIAIENISGAPDAFNNNISCKTLAPYESGIFKTTFKISHPHHETEAKP